MIALASDHGGLELKQKVIEYLEENKIEYKDFGPYEFDSEDDYPDFVEKACKSIQNKECAFGILVCGTGIGVSITANKFKGIRAALCGDTFSARMCRMHNNANVLTLGARVIGQGLALDIVKTWLETDFIGGKHKRRLDKIALIEEGKSIC
jgi:ribose 5-phosphate isomerase B